MSDTTQNTETLPNISPYLFDRIRTEAVTALTQTGLLNREHIALAEPKANVPADLACPVFAAAKATGAGSPPALAQKIAEAVVLPEGGLLASVESAGGFVNFTLNKERLGQETLSDVWERGAAYGADKTVGNGRRIILEYSSPNIARKMHVGHLRTTVIGHALHQMFDALGYEVIADNHLGDWGTQFGMLLAAIDLWQVTPWNDPDPVQSLIALYTRYNAEASTNTENGDDTLKNAARAWFKRLEDGDVWARETWQRLIDITMVEFERTYKRLDIRFTTQHGESYFEPMLDAVVQEALDKGVARVEPGGAVSVTFGEGKDSLPSCLLRKTDGGTLYQTRDAATCIYRWRTYGANLARNVYIVGAEQKLHFQQVFEIARRLGYTEIADKSLHIYFGQVTGASGERFSMRKGDVIFLEEVLDEAVTRARAVMREQIAGGKTEMTEAEIDEVGEMLGVGAVIYADLYQGPERAIAFDWDKMLAFDGNTATYIQYTHARCRSILRKSGIDEATLLHADASPLVAPEEQAVLKQLMRLPHALREGGEKFLPATIAEWTYTLAREYARFYHEHQVLEAPTPELRQARLALTGAVAQGLKNGLALLAIGAPERM